MVLHRAGTPNDSELFGAISRWDYTSGALHRPIKFVSAGGRESDHIILVHTGCGSLASSSGLGSCADIQAWLKSTPPGLLHNRPLSRRHADPGLRIDRRSVGIQLQVARG